MSKTKTVSINLRLPADLHKALVEASASNSPPSSLNSEILSRLYESFARPTVAALAQKVSATEAYAIARIKEVEMRAEELTQHMASKLAEFEELKRRAETKE